MRVGRAWVNRKRVIRFCRYTCPNHPVSGSSRAGSHRGTLEAVAEARRAEKGRPGHSNGGGKRSGWGGKKPARASGSQPLHMQPFSAASKQNLRTKANTGEQRYLAPAWPTNAMRDPRRGAATEMSRGEYATAMKDTHLGRLLALPHRARSPTAPKRTQAGPRAHLDRAHRQNE